MHVGACLPDGRDGGRRIGARPDGAATGPPDAAAHHPAGAASPRAPVPSTPPAGLPAAPAAAGLSPAPAAGLSPAPAAGLPPPQYPPPGYPPPPGYGAYPAPYYALPPENPTRIRRNGFTLGLAIGGGSVHFQDEPHAGFAFQFGIGGMLNRQVGVLFDYSTISHDVSSVQSESHTIFGAVAQLFLAEPLWIKAGLGVGRMTATDGWGTVLDRTEQSFAFIGGVGFDVLQTTSGFALDLQLRFTGASYKDAGFTSNTAVLVGFNFY